MTLDFNKTTMREATASDAINGILFASLQKKNQGAPRRNYVGASGVGHECARSTQFEFAGAPREKPFPDLTLRKFDFGHMGEELARQWFGDAGFTLIQSGKNGPLGFSQLDGRFKGHVDGVFTAGPEIPGVGYPALWETKSVGQKTYRAIERNGLRKERPAYYAQVQIYMAYLDLTDHPAIFTVTNLDSGEQLHLLIPFDADEAQRMTDRAVLIVKSTDAGQLLPRAFADREHFQCKSMCAFAERCWSLPD